MVASSLANFVSSRFAPVIQVIYSFLLVKESVSKKAFAGLFLVNSRSSSAGVEMILGSVFNVVSSPEMEGLL